jgi:LysR family glycine cleavage system transcriptional activator
MARVAHLKAIQAFEAVARTGSVTLAADDLLVSQSAISYHIQILETALGVKLFHRRSRSVQLTAAGERLLPHVRDGLQSIERGLQSVARTNASAVVRVAVLPMFASRWLAPRLSDFWDKFPKIELSFTHDNTALVVSDLAGEATDVAIQWGGGAWKGVECQPLLEAPLVATCSPELLKRAPIKSVADLAAHTLLHVDDHEMWRQWLVQADGDERLAQKGLLMSDRHFQLSATLNGVGVSLFIRSFIQSELDKGLLVSPLPLEFPTAFSYYLVRPKRPLSAGASRFYDWILGRAALPAK